jgi:hypothetical protein
MTTRRVAEMLLGNIPGVLPKIRVWVKEIEDEGQRKGRPLAPDELHLASAVGVFEPERIRLWSVPKIPRPEDPLLNAIADQLQVLGRDASALTLYYTVLVAHAYERDRHIQAHEFRHVHQYETFGSRDAFIEAYLAELIEFGHGAGRLELDAERAAYLHTGRKLIVD